MFNTSKLTQSLHVASTAAVSPSAAELRKAAGYYADRPLNSFCQGKDTVCLDLASKLDRFGSYASEKQQEYAAKLVKWTGPRPTVEAPGPTLVPRLFTVMQKHAEIWAESLKIRRRNQDTLCWITWRDVCVGKLEDGRLVIFASKPGAAEARERVLEFEADPLAVAKKYGRLAGRCCSCGRDLTDPVSIDAGIGPVCATKFG